MHTPGPWTKNVFADWTRIGTTKGTICKVEADDGRGKIGGITQEERHGNAALIESAPDLLQACKAAMQVFREMNEQEHGPLAMPSPIEEKLDEIIRKAEGK